MKTAMNIKSSGWHKVEVEEILPGVMLITGDTFDCKAFIKNYLNGKWEPTYNGWLVKKEMVDKYSNGGTTMMSK